MLPENVDRFSEIKNIRDLRESDIRIGQGAHWPDSSILEANGIPVITHTRYEILFRMLRNNRFDCFARGVSEVLYDQRVQNAEDLVIEPYLLLAYPMPSYLFTAPEDDATAQRLQLGLERAIEDGSFGNYLKTWYSRPVAELQLNRRTIIRLSNPFLSEESRNIGRQVLKNLDRRIDLLTAPD
ncbi:transporter substrate-binding domain-containing protein [Marinobacter nauticus]